MNDLMKESVGRTGTEWAALLSLLLFFFFFLGMLVRTFAVDIHPPPLE